MTISFTPEEIKEHFYNAICNLGGMESSSGCELSYKDEDYVKANALLDNPCYEDVLMQILENGDTLVLEDVEGGEDKWTINKDDLQENFKYVPEGDIMDIVNGDDDACTAWNIVQAVFMKEIVFG